MFRKRNGSVCPTKRGVRTSSSQRTTVPSTRVWLSCRNTDGWRCRTRTSNSRIPLSVSRSGNRCSPAKSPRSNRRTRSSRRRRQALRPPIRAARAPPAATAVLPVRAVAVLVPVDAMVAEAAVAPEVLVDLGVVPVVRAAATSLPALVVKVPVERVGIRLHLRRHRRAPVVPRRLHPLHPRRRRGRPPRRPRRPSPHPRSPRRPRHRPPRARLRRTAIRPSTPAERVTIRLLINHLG
jgi:hypothetical protein